jgi:ABC-type bacteriocin/lantibiotic exporter with double-glycine peptidase domain
MATDNYFLIKLVHVFVIVIVIVFMATSLPTPTVKDLAAPLFPLQLTINGQNYNFIVKSESIKYIADSKYNVQTIVQLLSNYCK